MTQDLPLNGTIPVLRPLLPRSSRLQPYLERIDASRIYSNWGPLVMELGQRLGAAFGVQEGSVICAASGMSALMGAILATAGFGTPGRTLAAMPDFTFVATGLSAQLCGYQLLLASSGRNSWTMRPEDLLSKPELVSRLGVVIPVAPFGRLEALADWERFQELTGVPVVIDAAASFETLYGKQVRPGKVPLVLSFHATKAFGIGEGGCVVTGDAALAARIEQCLNFGFAGSRNSGMCSVNGKMPEYAAAVGLAELDGWGEKASALQRMAGCYRHAFADAGVGRRLWLPPQISSSYVLLESEGGGEARALMRGLAGNGIETRLWYGSGLSSHDAFASCARVDLHGAAALDPATLVGLPVAIDLTAQQIGRIASVAHDSLLAAH